MIQPGGGRLFRILLAAYPRPFRDAYGDDMAALFAERLAEARRDGRLAPFWIRTIVNLFATGLAERRDQFRAARARRIHEPGSPPMSGFMQDARYAIRLLRRQPAFSLFVVLTLAVGIGATTAVFSVVNGVLLRPLPYPESDRLVNVWSRFDPESGFDFPQFVLSIPEYLDYKDHNRSMEDVAAMQSQSATITGAGMEPDRIAGYRVTANLFSILRTAPALGRTFSEAEMKADAPLVVLLSHGYWQSRFGADRSILGRKITVNGFPGTVIGVMPRGFAYPRETTQMWMPLRIDRANPGGRSSHGTLAVARLAPGASVATARAELQTLMADWKARFPTIHTGHYLVLHPMIEDVVGNVELALFVLFGATAFVLLIVCANVASIVLARGEARTREMAIRGALGASRRRLVRLSLIESSILGLLGGALGLGLAVAGVRALIAIDPGSIPRAAELGVDATIVGFAAAASLLAAAFFGLAPAFRGAGAQVQGTLREAALSTTGGVGRQIFRRTLVGLEVALTVLLVFGAAMMLRSFTRLTSVEPGFQPDGLLTATVAPAVRDYPEAAQVETFYETLLTRLEAMPGIRAASAGSTVPMLSDFGVWDFDIEGRAKPAPGQPAWNAKAVIVRPGYFETLGMPLVRGRAFTRQDTDRSQLVTVINQALAAKFFGGEDPIGRRLRIAGDTNPWMTIVGVSGDVRTDGLNAPAAPAYHFLQSQLPRTNGGPNHTMSVILRADDPDLAATALRTAVRELDPNLAIANVQTSRAVIDRSVAQPRFTTWLLGFFAGIGLLLGASGIYGVLAYTVARRTQEIGIRRALGAQRGRLAGQVILGGMVPVAAGLAVGLVASFWTLRYWQSQLFDVSATDPVVLATVIAGVFAIAVGAMIIPVLRALRVSPLVALRAD